LITSIEKYFLFNIQKMKIVSGLLLGLILTVNINAQSFKTKNIIFVTLDGLRWQEVFTGADSSLLLGNKNAHGDINALKTAFWSDTTEIRREKLMPFLWGEVVKKGQLYGNRQLNNNVNLVNKYWFSYPGYSELFTGFADDSVNSNKKKINPNVTIFEMANQTPAFKNKVAVFGSWDLFPYIVSQKRSGVFINAGNQPATGKITSNELLLNDLTRQMAPFTEGVRWDILTFHYAFDYLKNHKPRLLFIGFDETDDYAHMDMYDRYLMTAYQSDMVIGELWQWVQSQPEYKDQTTLIITCDHGRGGSKNKGWRSHGADIQGADQTWIAIIGPDTPVKGEVSVQGQLYSNQIARTITTLLGIKNSNAKAGNIIESAIKK
jgi:hypothetical protein